MMLFPLLSFCLIWQTVECITCPGLGEFNPDGAFEGWPDPTCPGDPDLELTFTMYQRDQLGGERFNRSFVPPGFISSGPTIFATHGFTSDGNTTWLGVMKDTIVNYIDNANAVIVSWGGRGGSQALYSIASSTTRTVGAELAEVMINLINQGGGSLSNMQCTGHSLGAHVCGHFGRWASGQGYRPPRVTGMDPAGPNFADNSNRSVGIYRDCGDFVDIIHTDRSSGSTPEPGGNPLTLGHQDFYPNDGHDQPGCITDSCSHSLSHELFTASIFNNCFNATETCTASNDIPGSCTGCGGVCGIMGYYASPVYGEELFRLDTGGAPPDYCL